MEIRVRSTGAVMYENELRRWLQETNGPSYVTLTPKVMELLGVDPVFEGPQASGGTVYQYSQRQGVEQVGDNWYAKYVLGPSFEDDAARLAYEAECDAAHAKLVRADRDARLAGTDWRVVKALEAGQPQDFAWAAYRQQLRDLTTQEGFPWNVVWPTEP
jgi:hypothetical protein